eukprot:Opistho-1_new@17684
MPSARNREEERFHMAVQAVQSLPKEGPFNPSNEQKLKFYSAFKQATEGPCDKPKPSFWDVVAKAKWDAWKGLGNMSKEDAMRMYVDNLLAIAKTLPKMAEIDAFLARMDDTTSDSAPAAEVEAAVDVPEAPQYAVTPKDASLANASDHSTKDSANGPKLPAEGSAAEATQSLATRDIVGIGVLLNGPPRTPGHSRMREAAILRRASLSGRRDGAPVNGHADSNDASSSASSPSLRANGTPRSTATEEEDVFCDPLELPPSQVVEANGGPLDDGRGVAPAAAHGIAAADSKAPVSRASTASSSSASSASVEEVRRIMAKTQQDLERTMSRVQALETAVNELRSRPVQSSGSGGEALWPLAETPRNTRIFLILWPVVVHLLFRLLSRRSRRRQV